VGLPEDVEHVIEELSRRLDADKAGRLRRLGGRLLELALRRVVSSNHTVIELIVAAHLLSEGYDVEVEHVLAPNLVCDIYAFKDGKSMIVEVETGFVPPENSVDPLAFRMARELSKVARYSGYSDYFAMATPPFHILQLPYLIFMPPREREGLGLLRLKRVIDEYYRKPPVSYEELLGARLHYVYVVLVDMFEAVRLTAREYYVYFVERPAQAISRVGGDGLWSALSPFFYMPEGVERGVSEDFSLGRTYTGEDDEQA